MLFLQVTAQGPQCLQRLKNDHYIKLWYNYLSTTQILVKCVSESGPCVQVKIILVYVCVSVINGLYTYNRT